MYIAYSTIIRLPHRGGPSFGPERSVFPGVGSAVRRRVCAGAASFYAGKGQILSASALICPSRSSETPCGSSPTPIIACRIRCSVAP